MNEDYILSPGAKLKRIRKGLKLKQSDIVGTEVTRNLVSAIENEKATLTPKVAEIVTRNINDFCKANNIDFHLTTSYLLEGIDEQEEKKANEYIDFLDKNIDNPNVDLSDLIKEVQIFLTKSNLYDKKLAIYEKLGDILKLQNHYHKSYMFYIKAFENTSRTFDDVHLVNLLHKLGHCCIRLNKLNEAIDFNDIALIYVDEFDKDLKYRLLFNNALCYKKLNLFDKALERINYLELIFSELNLEQSFQLLTLKANCFTEKKFFSDALYVYKNILDMLKEDDEDGKIQEIKLITYSNILSIYNMFKDAKNVKYHINRILPLLNNFNLLGSDYSSDILLEVAYGYYALDDINNYEDYLLKTINYAKKFNDTQIIVSSLNSLFELYIDMKNAEKINNFKNIVLELIALEILSKSSDLTFKLIKYYSLAKDIDSIKSLVDFVL